MKTLLLILSLLYLSSCAELLTHRTFINEMDRTTDPFFVPGQDFQVLPGDSGSAFRSNREIRDRTPYAGLSKQEIIQDRSLRNELRESEMRLRANERERYYELKPYLSSISERIYYLNLNPREREEYEQSLLPEEVLMRRENSYATRSYNSYRSNRENNLREIASLNPNAYKSEYDEMGEVYVGMTKSEVRKTWGRASKVEVAGDPMEENERWAFYHNGRIRYVYFEQGVVQGWQQD